MDVEIRISQITPEYVASYFTPDETGEGLSWEWAERQNRLLSAMLKDGRIFGPVSGWNNKVCAGVARRQQASSG
jgi:hypothetical protein